jgi:hypothetical protein
VNTRAYLCNRLWAASCGRQHRSFIAALDRVEAVQEEYLLRLIRRNAGTHFGRDHRFREIGCPSDFQQAVPISGYDAYAPYVQAIADGEQRVLTGDPVELFQPTSGTASPSKLIPYTRSLRAEFLRGIRPWVAELFAKNPELLRGPAYWSISPPVRRPEIHGRLRVGFDDDSQYLGFLGKSLFSGISAVPSDVSRSADMDTFFSRTLFHLLMAEDLALISVWSPTLLLALLDRLAQHMDQILTAIAASPIRGASARARKIGNLMSQKDSHLESIWPHLQMVSCWTDGPSKEYADQIRNLLPHVEIQGKGLVATEAFVSLPLAEGSDPVLAAKSHFFEFRDTETGRIVFAHEVSEGRTYSVIVTTGGGLYRYSLGDLVEVTGFLGQAPTLRFVCRESVSDIVGEKLNEVHVQMMVKATLIDCALSPRFFLMAPITGEPGNLSYCLFVDAPALSDGIAVRLRDSLEERLLSNFHYRLCRDMRQLGLLRVFQIDRSSLAPEEAFFVEMQRRGMKLGDIKQSVLEKTPGWERRFHGRFVA